MSRILGAAVLAATLLAISASPAGSAEMRVSQVRHAEHVLAFFDKHSWLSAPNKERCKQVAWTRSCLIARERIRFQTRVIERYHYGHIVEKLDRGLAGSPMAGLGETLDRIGRRYNVSPFFMAAAAGTESSFGAAGCSNNPKNVWGLAACDGRWHVPYFNSWDEAITFYAKFLADRWPSATSPHHFYGYAACNACWGRKTAWWMGSRFGVSAYTKYPLSRQVASVG